MAFKGKTVLTNNIEKIRMDEACQKGNDKRLKKLKQKEEAALRLRGGGDNKMQ